MPDEHQFKYGLSTDLFVTRKSNESIVVSGVASDTSRWVRILSYRAAQLLWFQLAQMLHPEQAKASTTVVTTAPMRDAALPTITTHTTVEKLQSGSYEITGWFGDKAWRASVSGEDVERFWSALDKALYPAGLEKSDTSSA